MLGSAGEGVEMLLAWGAAKAESSAFVEILFSILLDRVLLYMKC